MLVDLGRNDIGKISQIGTVEVEKYMAVERYSHVMHIGSTVGGRFDPEYDAVDAVEQFSRREHFPELQNSVPVRSSRNWRADGAAFTEVLSAIWISLETWMSALPSALPTRRRGKFSPVRSRHCG